MRIYQFELIQEIKFPSIRYQFTCHDKNDINFEKCFDLTKRPCGRNLSNWRNNLGAVY